MSEATSTSRGSSVAKPAKGFRPKGVQLFVDWRHVALGDNVYIAGDKVLRNWKKKLPGTVARPDSAHGIRLEAQAGEMIGPLFECDKPWESAYLMYVSTVLLEDGVYRMWYATTPDDHADGSAKWGIDIGLVLCYAESKDGIIWRKPNLGLVSYKGNKDNNIVYGRDLNGDGFSSGTVFLDSTAASPGERYKLFYKGRMVLADAGAREKKVRELQERFGADNIDPACLNRGIEEHAIYGVFAAVSSDGIRWQPLKEPLFLHYSDTLNNVHVNGKTGHYVAYLRMRRGQDRRVVGRLETRDFKHWPGKPQVVLEAPLTAHPGDDIYHGVVSTYPEGSDTHLMFATVFRQLTDSRHVELASSVDGKYWSLVPGHRLVEPGDLCTWAAGDTHMGQGIVPLSGNRVAAPFVAYTESHKAPRFLGKPHGAPGFVAWTKDRLCAIVADEVGTFATNPIVCPGTSLVLNLKTTFTGSVLVEMRDESGAPVSGFTFADADVLNGNDTDRKVTWRGSGDLSARVNKSVSFAFRLRCASLYSFRFE